MTSDKAVGFIGLGAMGHPMASNLAKGLPPGSKLHVYDIAEDVAEDLHQQFWATVVKCTSVREVTDRSDVIFTMLPESEHVLTVYTDASHGIMSALSPESNKTLIDCSTIDVATSRDLKHQLQQKAPKSLFYDAPVSGGVLGAVDGTISFMLGCRADDPQIEFLRSLFSLMGRNIIPCGGPSLGLAAKITNNYLSGVITLATSEAMDMGMRAGIDARTLASVFSAGTAQNTIADKFNPVPGVCPAAPASNGYRGGFRVQLMRKDMGLALGMARQIGSTNVLGLATFGVYSAASEAPDCKNLDSRVVFRYLKGREGWSKGEA